MLMHTATGKSSFGTVPNAGRAPLTASRTLRVLRWLRTGLVCLVFALFVATVHVVQQEQQELHLIAEQAQPALQSAYAVEHSLQELEVASLRTWLGGQGDATRARQLYEEDRVNAIRNLLHASQSFARDAQAESSLEDIALNLESFERLAGQSQELQSKDPVAAAAALHLGLQLLGSHLLPAGMAMEDGERGELQDLRQEQDGRWTRAGALFFLSGGCLLFALVLTQVSLSRRTRRTLNPALVAATLLLALSGTHIARSLLAARADLLLARDHELASAEHMWQLRQHALAAQADDGLRFLGQSNEFSAAKSDEAFHEEAHRIAESPGGLTPAQLLAALRESGHVYGFSGLFATEIEESSAPGDREAILGALAAWQRLLQQHADEDVLLHNGQRAKAVDLFLHGHPRVATPVAPEVNQALQTVISTHQAALEGALSQGEGELRRAEPEAVAVLALAGLLVVFAFAPRIREYA